MDPLYPLVSQAASRRVVVIGDIILDRYIHGAVRRISQEAPVPVVELHDQRVFSLGGAANVAHNLTRLGCRTALVGVVGQDEEGTITRRLLDEAGIDAGGVLAAGDRATAQKTRVVGNHRQMLRIDRETTHPVDRVTEEQALRVIAEKIAEAEVVVVSDYAKGFLSPALVEHAIARAHERGAPVLVAPKGRDFTRYRGCDVLVLNQSEAETATGWPLHDDAHLSDAANTLLAQTSARHIVITLGARGIYLHDRTGASSLTPCEPREVFDVTGAGDTVLATLAWLYRPGQACAPIVRIANAAAGIVVGKEGVVPVERDELIARLQYGRLVSKIKPPASLKAALERARQTGKTIVFTNGCFDLLHPGHVQLLRASKNLGDVLVVAINTDASVRRLKGEGRPILKEHERAEMLAALECVDHVVLFDDPTPVPLLEMLRPDILVKGAEYSHDQVVGWEVVEGYGGRVERIPLVAGLSTTDIVARVLRSYGLRG